MEMKIYDFENYKTFINYKIKELPSNGRGEITKMAKALNVHTTMMTHILKGKANLAMEQGLKLANYLNLNELETDFFILLVQWERSGDEATRLFWQKKITKLKNKALNLSHRLQTKNELSESDRVFYYSNWIYSGIRLLTAIKRFQTIEALSKELDLSKEKVRTVLEFLSERGLVNVKGSQYSYGLVPTYLESVSPMIIRHHMNWRHKAQQHFDKIRTNDLLFTFPVILSEEDAQKIRGKLVEVIEEIKKISDPSPSDEFYILNLDWLKLTREK